MAESLMPILLWCDTCGGAFDEGFAVLVTNDDGRRLLCHRCAPPGPRQAWTTARPMLTLVRDTTDG